MTPGPEAVIGLELQAADGRRHRVDAVLDTGFTSSLTLPPATIVACDWGWVERLEFVDPFASLP